MTEARCDRTSYGADPCDESVMLSARPHESSHFRLNGSGVMLDYQSSTDTLPARSAAADAIGEHVSTILPKEFATPILRGVDECLRSRSVVDVDCTLELDDGTVQYWQARLAPHGDDEVIGIVCDNTANRMAASRLAHLAEILEASTDYIATTDTAGDILYANSAFRDRFGVGPIEQANTHSPSLFDFFTAAGRELFLREGVQELWKTGRWSGEIEGIDANGVAVPLSQSAIRHRNADGRAQYFSGIARDISENKAAQLALFESEQRFHALIAHSNDATFVVTANGRISYASPAIERMIGHTPAELIGTRCVQLIHPDDVDLAIASLTNPTADEPEGIQTRVRHRDGTWRWIESYQTNHLDTPGVHGFIINARDITARKRANEQIERASALLASVMGATTTEAIIVTDESASIVAFSGGAEVLLGYSADDVVGRPYPRAFHLEQQMTEAAVALGIAADELFLYAPPDGLSIVRDWVFVRRDGSHFPGSLTVSSRLDSHGTPCGFLFVARDITEQRRVEAELAEQAHHDTLTGLGNRARLQIVLQSAIEGGTDSGCTLLFIDLDRFKSVNDTYGHATGDAVLRGTAQRLIDCLRADDVATRLGGDEFVVVLRPNPTEQAATKVAERIIAAIARPFAIDGNQVCVGASIGLATGAVDTTMDELLLRADQALYAAKSAGRGQVVVAPVAL